MKLRLSKVALACALGISAATANIAQAANPAAFSYASTANVSKYAKPTGMVISGRCNWTNPAFSAIRSKGGEHLVYINPVERPDHTICALDKKFYMNNLGAVPLWPFPSYGQRYSWPGTKLTDMRPGSKWILHVVAQVEKLMRDRRVDGVMLDSTGARLWRAPANWSAWSTRERNLWTDGTIDLVRRLDAKRKQIRPDFIIVNNGTWDRGDSRGFAGERYVDGVVVEKAAPTTWRRNYVKKPFGPGGPRRVIVIARNASDAATWNKVPGVTHVTYQSNYRQAPSKMYGSFKRLNN